MKPILFLVGLLAAAVLAASAQETKPLPPRTIREAISVPGTPTTPVTMIPDSHSNDPSAYPFFCPPKTCLYYAGDFDTSSPNGNGLFDIDNPGIGDGEVWVGVRPSKNVVITGTAGYYFSTATSIGINPTPFAVRTGISAGNEGKLVCSTGGNATFNFYGPPCAGSAPCEIFYVAKLAKACHLKARKTYFVDLTPQYNDGSTIGYLMDVEKKPANHKGWPNVWDSSYFNSTSFGVNYEPTWGNGGACGGIGCSGFSISLTGKEQ